MMIAQMQNAQSIRMFQSQESKTSTQKMSPLEKQKMNIQNQMQQILGDKTLSEEEKMAKIQALDEQLGQIEEQLGQKQLEDIKNSGKELAEKMAEDAEKATDDAEKEKKAQVAMAYGMISGTGEISRQRTLTSQREKAVQEEGPESDRVKRIDNMLTASREKGLAGAYLAAKASAEYAKAKQANDENRQTQKAEQTEKPVENIEIKPENAEEKIYAEEPTKETDAKDEKVEKKSEQPKKAKFTPQKPKTEEIKDFLNVKISSYSPKINQTQTKINLVG